MVNYAVSDRCFRVVLNSSVHYLWKDNIVDIRMGYEERETTSFSTEVVPSIEVYEKRKFLWIFPYKKCVFSCSPIDNTREQAELLKVLYVTLYEWWKFNKWDRKDENKDS